MSNLILVVDDDELVRRSMTRALRARGYTILEAGDAESALQQIRNHGADISLLISDIALPGIDGRDLARLARAELPALEVLYTSGHDAERAETAFLQKPFRVGVLLSKVQQLLDASERERISR